MSKYEVEVSRRVRLVVDAPDDDEARNAALEAAWGWLPESASGGDQGSASAGNVRLVEL